MSTVSQALARHVASRDFATLPDDALAAAKWFLLDTLGVAWAGTDAPGVAPLRKMIAADGGTPESTLWASGTRVPAASAALVNGTYAGALDYDGVYEKGSVHPDIVTLPAALAVAERQHSSGRELLAALAIGNDIACRSGGAMAGNPGWFNTAVHGVFGAAAAAAKLLGLDEAGVAHALGLALSHAGGTQQALIEKSLVKRLHSGIAARAGVFSAVAAGHGISAPLEVFEGKFGFYALYGFGDPAALLDGLGERFLHVDTVTKKFPSCTANHVAIEGAIALAERHDLRADDVTSVDVVVSPFMHGLVGAPFDPSGNGQVAAQFSVQYSIACALARRRLGIAEIQDAAIFDDGINALANKVHVAVNDAWPGKFAPCELTVHTATGGPLHARVEHTPGTAQNPLSRSDLEAKFCDCVGAGARPLDGARAEALIQRVQAIDEVDDVSGLMADLAR